MTFGITAGQAFLGGTALLGGLLSSKGATSAAKTQAAAATQQADTQAQAAREALALQERMYERQIGLQEPYRQAGLTGQNRLMELMGLGGNTGAAGYGKYARDFGTADFQQDPGYAFRLSEGQKALDRQAAARGGLISGGALKAATRYGQEMGSQEYQNAFNRYQTQRTNQLQPLGSLMASGQSAASNQGSAAGQYGASGGNLITGAGQAIGAGQYGAGQSMAAGQLGVGNTMGNALGTIGSMYQTNQMMNRFYPVSDSSSQDMSGFQTPYIQPTYPTTTPGLGSGMYLR
jgi:hypothetical protein